MHFASCVAPLRVRRFPRFSPAPYSHVSVLAGRVGEFCEPGQNFLSSSRTLGTQLTVREPFPRFNEFHDCMLFPNEKTSKDDDKGFVHDRALWAGNGVQSVAKTRCPTTARPVQCSDREPHMPRARSTHDSWVHVPVIIDPTCMKRKVYHLGQVYTEQCHSANMHLHSHAMNS